MFERLTEHAGDIAERRAQSRRDEVAERLRQTLPRGIEVDVENEGVRLGGRMLARRFGLDAGLRWLIGEQLR